MDLETFLKKFYPDYEKEFNYIKSNHGYADEVIPALIIMRRGSFSKILENFTDQVCKKQREICADDVKIYVSLDSSPDPTDLEEIINGSFTPNIEEL